VKVVPPPVPIPRPPVPPPGLAADVVASGLPVHPEDRVRLFSSDQWERFVQEWVDSLRDEYELVERCGGAGDMGRDVIATVKAGNGAWDNYQCKHYQKALEPSEIQDLADSIPKLLEIKTKSSLPMTFHVQIELGDGREEPDETATQELNELLEEIKDGFKLQ